MIVIGEEFKKCTIFLLLLKFEVANRSMQSGLQLLIANVCVFTDLRQGALNLDELKDTVLHLLDGLIFSETQTTLV